jgi:serine/threonine protein phosphatase PrpC
MAASAELPAPTPRESAPPTPAPAAVTSPAPSSVSGPVRVRYFGRTDVGLVREHNEDNFVVVDLEAGLRGTDAPREAPVGPRGCIFAVCDGMGGAAAGEVASQMAVDTIHEMFAQSEVPKDRDTFARRLVHSVEEAGHRIFSAAKMDRSRRGMGTTTTLAGLVDNVLFVGQVGDSRAYVLRGDQLELVTKDQSLVNQLIEAGQLTEEEAEAFEHSNIILQALGTTEDVTVDLTFLELRRGDRLLMCSDGLSGLVHAEMIREVMQTTPDLTEAAARLIQMANAGGGHDNITVILADFDGEGLAALDGVRVKYQQYPLPPDDTDRGQALPAREPSIKAGGPKPGADVKWEASAASASESTLPSDAPAPSGGSKMGLILGAVVVVLLLLGGAALALGGMLGGDDTPPEVTPPPASGTPTTPGAGTSDTQRQPVPPATQQGTLVVQTDLPEGTTLWVNGQSRGPLTDGMRVELAQGVYRVEARDGDAPTSTQENVVVVPGQSVTIRLDAERGADPGAEPGTSGEDPGADPGRDDPGAEPTGTDEREQPPTTTAQPERPRPPRPPTKRDRPRIEPRQLSPGPSRLPTPSSPAPPSNPF